MLVKKSTYNGFHMKSLEAGMKLCKDVMVLNQMKQGLILGSGAELLIDSETVLAIFPIILQQIIKKFITQRCAMDLTACFARL
jgi:hypothetical protein